MDLQETHTKYAFLQSLFSICGFCAIMIEPDLFSRDSVEISMPVQQKAGVFRQMSEEKYRRRLYEIKQA